MSFVKIALTTGDADGIGLEVTAKSLARLGPQSNTCFFLFRAVDADSKWLKMIDRSFERIVVDDLAQAFDFFNLLKKHRDLSKKILVDIASDLSPATWVEQCAKACLKKDLQALVTAPLSKTCIQDAGFRDMGHTGILQRVSSAPFVHMGFLGDQFNVVLATAHLPVKDVHRALTPKALRQALTNANSLRKVLSGNQAKKPIAILGFNPHAGENGLIGKEEKTLFPSLIHWAETQKIPVAGPLVPDAAFLKQNWDKYSVFLALYHDQGLIPFKCIHGQDSGVHISLGLPFVRTSVDHGTAKDIFGLNKANPNSMLDAIQWSLKLSSRKQRS